jgi:hypothetical protein
MGAIMFIHDQNDSRPNYMIEAIAGTVIAICIGINLFGDNLGFTTLDSKPADGFGGFKMVNVGHNHHNN